MKTRSAYKQQTFTEYKNGEEREYTVYWTMTPGVQIVNALTGYTMPGKVGSAFEDKYFRVMMATGKFDGGPAKLFFETIDEYEELFRTRLSSVNREMYQKKFV
jgi:hypothetical protein